MVHVESVVNTFAAIDNLAPFSMYTQLGPTLLNYFLQKRGDFIRNFAPHLYVFIYIKIACNLSQFQEITLLNTLIRYRPSSPHEI